MKVIQQIFKDHATDYVERYGDRMPAAQRKVLDAVCKCRTPESGQHLFVCPECEQEHLADSSCGNRHCPICQNDKAAQWVYRRQLKRLPCSYFLTTFTLPRQFHGTARRHPDQVYRALFDASAESLKALEADKRFVGCKLTGFFGILHTWGRQIQYHPHVHYVVAGGGLSEDREQWIAASGDFLVHVRALSTLFKGKFRAQLAKHGLQNCVPDYVWKKNWVVHCKSVGDGERVLKYLGAYVFRVAISNARIVDYDGKRVSFKYYKVNSNRPRTCTLDALEFIRRYLQHVLPKGFMKVRHYGFLSRKCSVAIEKIREMIYRLYQNCRRMVMPEPPEKIKPLLCKQCNTPMRWVRFISPLFTTYAGP